MKYNNQTYRNLQDQVWYLTNYLENEAQLVELGIRVVGAKESLPIPEGVYEYGDAYMIGTKAPFTMYVWTRANESHPEDYWFEVGPFPLPGPAGKDGSLADITASTTTNNIVTYDSTDGAHVVGTTNISYKDSAGETKTSSYQNEFYVPIAAGDEYLTMDADVGNTKVEIKLDKPSLALDFYQVAKPSDGSTSVPAWDGTKIVSIPYNKNEYAPLKNALVKTGSKGEMSVNRIYFPNVSYEGESSAFIFNEKIYGIERMFTDLWTKDLEITTSSSNSGTLSAGDVWRVNNAKNINILYRGYSHIRQTPVKNTGIIRYVSTECNDNTITVRNFLVNAQSGAWTWEERTFPTVSYYTHRVVIYDGGDNVYYTITLTNSRADAYANLGDNLTSLFNDIGTSGVMAYKNTAEGQYVPVLLTRDATSESSIHWQTGTQTGTIEQSNIAGIQDHITPAITNN